MLTLFLSVGKFLSGEDNKQVRHFCVVCTYYVALSVFIIYWTAVWFAYMWTGKLSLQLVYGNCSFHTDMVTVRMATCNGLVRGHLALKLGHLTD